MLSTRWGVPPSPNEQTNMGKNIYLSATSLVGGKKTTKRSKVPPTQNCAKNGMCKHSLKLLLEEQHTCL